MDIKTAVVKAKEYFQDFYPEKKDTFRIEETEFNDKSQSWEITLSFIDSLPVENPILGNFANKQRVFKTVYLSDKDGRFIKMKIRTI